MMISCGAKQIKRRPACLCTAQRSQRSGEPEGLPRQASR